MSEKKITKRDRFNELLALEGVASNEALVEFINHEIALLDKKNASRKSSDKPTKAQLENEALKDKIVEVLESGVDYTATQIAKIMDLSTQKVSPLLKAMTNEDTPRVVRTEVKGKPIYTLA